MTVTEYTGLVDEVASAIQAGRLKPGDRLPPQRTFAYQKGIAASTAGRVYAELVRRGLVVGEVGRGTFVAGQQPSSGPIRGEPRDGPQGRGEGLGGSAAVWAGLLVGVQGTGCQVFIQGAEAVAAGQPVAGPVAVGMIYRHEVSSSASRARARWMRPRTASGLARVMSAISS